MALKFRNSSISRLAVLCFSALFGLIILVPELAMASGRGSFYLSDTPPVDIDAQSTGICASAVTVHGYPCREFDVKTDDGYILSVQRIPGGRAGGGAGLSKQPVLLQHGVLVDGMTWLLNSPEQSLALILADNGFDVWISNIRGTRYSRRHVNLDPSEPEFWNWTWDDLVVHDFPSVIHFIFNQTGQKIHYVGHSMGTLIALASFSEGRSIDKVKSATLLSPIAYLSHMTTALGVAAARAFVSEITTIFGLAEFNPKSDAVSQLLKEFCAQPGVDCYDLLSELTGKNCCLNASTVELFLKNEPQATSTKNLVHMAQTVRDGMVTKYDYGNAGFNLAHYGESKPPVYNLGNIPHDLPLFLSYGGQDALSDVKDVETLLDGLKLHDMDKLHVQYIKDYAHADFIMGITAKDVVYNQIIRRKRLNMEAVYNVLLVLFAVFALVVEEALAEKHVVGGSQGWDESTDFNTWASGKTFKVGDQLEFKYSAGLHSVVELGSESAYKSCDTSTSVNSMTTGNDVVKLDKPGTRYFACGTPGHCGQGMKVKITTGGANGSPATPSSSSSSTTSPASTSATVASPAPYFATLVLFASLLGLQMLFFM